ncbi:hypothetical protein SCLCIDRAFT_1220335 [Scleroderma citrinum Foug A]|uniref:Uncharacterized protein n=1 Tax=Scleroderma citrinum Foug A TaxID=1036808 RepID=A0A0C3D6X5_9AGAM|nr:hypothetical protein SCLCIDRAFT_1220335 [Scleroderma citrinum Foug A]
MGGPDDTVAVALDPITCALDFSKDDASTRILQHLIWRIPRYVQIDGLSAVSMSYATRCASICTVEAFVGFPNPLGTSSCSLDTSVGFPTLFGWSTGRLLLPPGLHQSKDDKIGRAANLIAMTQTTWHMLPPPPIFPDS